MSEQTLQVATDPGSRRHSVRQALRDLLALGRLLEEGRFDDPVRRIGAEQELVFVDVRCRPAPVGLDVLERLDDPRFTTELSLFNLEYNAPPIPFGDDCLSRLEADLTNAVAAVRAAAEPLGAWPILTGILPTLRKSDLELANITPRPRYLSLVKALRELRGEAYEFRITGPDELIMRHESVMLEAANTSSQFHWQVRPDEFATTFNAAQAIAAPVLAAAVNSPLLFGRRLWRETRIALFQQAVDTRRPFHAIEHRSARVRFGEDWVHSSALELFQEDLARFRLIMAEEIDEDPLEVVEAGGIPALRALRLHLGTVYRWTRACYGMTNGRPHLRIENRVLPSGPTVVDEVANAAFWYGLLAGVTRCIGDVTRHMSFDDARANFQLAGRLGLDAPLSWLGRPPVLAGTLIEEELLPLARKGLEAEGIHPSDVDRYLGIIAERVATRRTGARWLLVGLRDLRAQGTLHQALSGLVAALARRQLEGRPVHEWSPADVRETDREMSRYLRVDQLMTTDVFTVRDDDVIDLAASVMDWKHVRHVPVEDQEHRLVGLVSYRQLLRHLARSENRAECVAVRDVMQPDPVTVTPETSTLDAMALMREQGIPCLPVVRDERLVGILTERDFIPVAARLLEARLRES